MVRSHDSATRPDVIGVPGMRAPFGLGPRSGVSGGAPPLPPLPGVPGPTPARRGPPIGLAATLDGAPRAASGWRSRRRRPSRRRPRSAPRCVRRVGGDEALAQRPGAEQPGDHARAGLPQRRQAERGAQRALRRRHLGDEGGVGALARREAAERVEAVERGGRQRVELGRRRAVAEAAPQLGGARGGGEVGGEEVDGRGEEAEHRHHLRLPRRHLGVEQQEERPPELLRELAQLVAVGARLAGAGDAVGEEFVVELAPLRVHRVEEDVLPLERLRRRLAPRVQPPVVLVHAEEDVLGGRRVEGERVWVERRGVSQARTLMWSERCLTSRRTETGVPSSWLDM